MKKTTNTGKLATSVGFKQTDGVTTPPSKTQQEKNLKAMAKERTAEQQSKINKLPKSKK